MYGAPAPATLNALLTLAGGFAAGWIGLMAGRQLIGR